MLRMGVTACVLKRPIVLQGTVWLLEQLLQWTTFIFDFNNMTTGSKKNQSHSKILIFCKLIQSTFQ